MEHPSSEPVRERRANRGRATPLRVGLFSDPPQAAVFEQHRSPVSDSVDWQAIPFSHGIAERRRAGRPRLAPGPQHAPAASE